MLKVLWLFIGVGDSFRAWEEPHVASDSGVGTARRSSAFSAYVQRLSVWLNAPGLYWKQLKGSRVT